MRPRLDAGTTARPALLLFASLTTGPLPAAEAPQLGSQSALAPASAQAAGIATLSWALLIVATLVFLLVMGLLAASLWRSRRDGTGRLGYGASRNLVLAAGVALPLAVVIVLVGGSLKLGRAIASAPPSDAINIEVTGWRWWWEVRYLDADGETLAVTANEIHVPVGRPVALTLRSEDVIHSFWVPELQGKTDMIPGVVNTSWFEADRPGIYRGQCAEFCGLQHALMAFLVIAETPADFERWLQRQRQPARAPLTASQRAGREAFLELGCAGCHTIRGTGAAGDSAPDLTHIGSRLTLAAVSRPNTIGHLGGWILDPQSIKPGNLMPASEVDPDQLNALIDYLRSLNRGD